MINADIGLTNSWSYSNFLDWNLSFQKLDTLNISPPSPDTSSKVPVVIDGREIFKIGQTDKTTAEERVEIIESGLKAAIKSEKAPNVKVENQKNGLAVLKINNRYLFTVTRNDRIGEETNSQRARYLKRVIAEAIQQAQKERTNSYLLTRVAIALGWLLLALMGSRLLEQLQRYPLRQAVQKVIPGLPDNSASQPSNLTTLLRVKLGFAQVALWIITILVIIELFYFSRAKRYEILHWIDLYLDTFLFEFGGANFSLAKLFLIVGLLIGLVIVSNYVTNLLRTKVLQATRINRGSQEVILTITKYGFIAFGVLIVLQSSGIDLTSIIAFGGVLSFGIVFGLQDIARNFASGLVLLFERSVQVGDFIEVGNHIGTVEIVRARSIVLKTLDRISIIVPNSQLLGNEVINWSYNNSASRLHLPIGVAYGCDMNRVKNILLKAADEHLEVLRNPKPQVVLTDFGDSSINFELLIWISDPTRQLPIKSDLYFSVEAMFREQQIEIPFPQTDLNLRTGDLPLSLPPELEGHLLYLLKGLIAKQYNNGKQ